MPTVFKKPLNNLTTTLAHAYTPGSGTMTVRAGDGARFGAVSTSAPIRFTCVKAAGVTKVGQVDPISAISIYFATGITGDTLSGVTVAEGTTDQAFAVGDFLTMTITAGTITDIQTAVNTLESGGGVSGQVTTNTAAIAANTTDIATNTTDIATNATGLASHVANTANPHAVTAAQVGNSIAQWNASSLQGKAVDATAPTDGQPIVYDGSTSKWAPKAIAQDQVSGLASSLGGKADGPAILDPALRTWRAALSRVAAGSGTAEITLLGDSISEGFSTADHTTDSFSALLRERLQNAFGGGGTGMTLIYRTTVEDSLYPPYWSFSGTWTNQNASGPYASGKYASGAAYAEIIVTGDTADIYHLLSSSGVAATDAAAATWSVDGGAATAFNTFAASDTETRLTISLGSFGQHTVRITAPTDIHVLILWGLTARKSTGAYVHNFGKTGAVANDVLLGFSGIGVDDSAKWLGSLASDLVIIAYASNDYWFQVPIADYKAHVTTLIQGAQAAGSSVLLLATNPRGDVVSPTIPQSDYWQALADLAAQYGCAYLSMGSRWKDVATQQAIGFDSGDTVHPNKAGHADYYHALAGTIGIPVPVTPATVNAATIGAGGVTVTGGFAAFTMMQDADIGYRWVMNANGHLYFQFTADHFTAAPSIFDVNGTTLTIFPYGGTTNVGADLNVTGKITGDGSGLTNLPSSGGTPGGTSGQIQFNDAGAFAGGPIWDAGHSRIGIGTTTPGAPIHISGVTADVPSTFWMTCGTSAGNYSSMLFGEGSALNTGDYAEMIRYASASAAGTLPGDFGVTNLNNRVFISTNYVTSYRVDLLVDANGLVGVGPASGLAAQFTVETKDSARPAIVARGAASQGANLIEAQAHDGTPLGGIAANGTLLLATVADIDAPDGSIFFGSDHLDSASVAKLCRKQGGVVTPIG